MKNKVNSPKDIWRAFLVSAACLVAGIVAWLPYSAAQAGPIPGGELISFEPVPARRSFMTEPCQLPAAGGIAANGGALGGALLGQGQGVEFINGSALLVIPCMRFDRTHYAEGDQWAVTILVTNYGTANSGVFDVYGFLCRFHVFGISLACQDDFGSTLPLAINEPGLAPGESRLINYGPSGFGAAPPDENQTYESWVEGYPDNGTVFLIAGIGGSTEQVVAQAVYPSAPDNPAADDPAFIDADGDGWSPPEDCDDQNPETHPGGLEIFSDGQDNDCSGGDVPQGACGDETVSYRDTCLPIGVNDLGGIDMDGDGFTPDAGDCDDSNSWTHPSATEFNDNLDNNCNGLVDEGFGVPDWFIEEYDVDRTAGEHTFANGYSILVPGLAYDTTIGNAGDYMGDDLLSIQAVGHYVIFHPQPMATGTSGFIPYTQLPTGYLYGCTEQALTAVIADTGIYGEINTSNNGETFWLPPITEDYLSLHFDEMPSLTLFGGQDSTQIVSHAAITGSCPDLPTTLDGGSDYIQIHRLLIGKHQVLHNDTLVGLSYIPAISLPDDMSGGDLFCLQVTLDPNHLVSEIDPDDNMYAIVYEYHNPIFGPPRFDAVEYVQGPASPVDFNTDDCVVSVTGALMGDSPEPSGALVGAVLVGLAGGAVGGVLGRALGGGGKILVLLAGSGVVLGSGVGGVVGNAMGSRSAPRNLIDVQARASGPVQSCNAFLDPASPQPANGTVYPAIPGELHLSLAVVEATDESTPTTFRIQILSPSGREAYLDVMLDGSADQLEVDVTHHPALLGSTFLSEGGEYRWSVLNGSYLSGGDLNPLEIACQGSSVHSFLIEMSPILTPTPTPTVSPTQPVFIPPTSTPTKPSAPAPTAKPPKLTPTPTTKPTKPSG